MEITQLELEVGQTKAVRVVGRTKAGRDHDIEGLTAEVIQNPEAFTVDVDVENDTLNVTCNAEGDGTLAIACDGRIGDGVRPIEKLLVVHGRPEDAVDVVFQVEDAAPPAEGGEQSPVVEQ